MNTNKIMRIASCLLIAVVLSTCAISGTFAKYVTSGSAEDVARVAKWGVTVTGQSGAFGKYYKDTKLDANSAECTVASSTDDNVLAPGTNGTFAAYSVTGTPEVDVTVTYAATVSLTGNWEDADGNYYCPIVVTVNGTNVTAGATAAEYAANIKAAIEGVTKLYQANDDLSAVNDDLTITWAWLFEAGNDAKDTALGNIAAGLVSGKIAPAISVSTTLTVTQVD